MVVLPRPTPSGARPVLHHLLLSHLIVSFATVTLFNSYAVEGRHRVPVYNTYGNVEYEYTDSEESTTSPQDDSNSFEDFTLFTNSTSATNKTTLTASETVTRKIANYDPYGPYMKHMDGPLSEDEVEYSLDYYNEKNLMKEYDFNSNFIVKQLINRAISQNTTPAQFLEEIGDLIALQNRSRVEQDETSKGRDEVPKLPAGFLNLNENLIKSVYDGWKNELKRLEKKYNITAECCGGDSITATRLTLMFPHYLNFGQKPFAAYTEISLRGQNNYNYNYNSYSIPSFFKRYEFGGLIPRWDLNNSTRQTIIGVHLYALYRDAENDMVPFRTKCIMLRRRMEISVLSDARRLRFLINNDIINREGQFLKTSLKNAYESIPSDFKNKIDWTLLNFERFSPGTAYIPQRVNIRNG